MFPCKHMYQPGSFRKASPKKSSHLLVGDSSECAGTQVSCQLLGCPLCESETIWPSNRRMRVASHLNKACSLLVWKSSKMMKIHQEDARNSNEAKFWNPKSQRKSVTGDHRRSWEQHPAIGQVSAKRVSHVPCAAPMKRHSAWPCGFRNKKLQQTSAQMHLKPWNH